jgi:hypothetical protein
MHFTASFQVKAPSKFVYDWMTTPTPGDTAYTRGLTSREITETWKFQNTTKDKGTLAGRPYASKAVLRKYPPSRWRVEEEAGAWYHRTEFALEDTPEGTELKVSMEILVRGLRRYFAKSFRRKFSADFNERIGGWVARIEEEARALPAESLAPAPPEKKKVERPIEIPKQYGS